MMLEKLLGDVSHFAIPVTAIAAVLIATMRYGVPALLAAFLVSKGRKASIRSTKQGIEILTDVPGPIEQQPQAVLIASIKAPESEAPRIPKKQSELDITDSVEKALVTAFEAGR